MPRSFEDVFTCIEADSEQTQFLIRASYLEIYNEEIRDLLAKNLKVNASEMKYSALYLYKLLCKRHLYKVIINAL